MTTERQREAQTGRQPDPEVLRRDIERTRAELGDTVEALAARADVAARARAKRAEMTAAMRSVPAKVARNPAPFIVGAAAVTFVILFWGANRRGH